MDKYYYRLNIGRYLLLIAFGCYLYLYPEHRVKKYQLISMFLIGLGYIVAVFGFNWDIILFGYWKTTAMPIAFYIFPIIILLFRRFYHIKLPGVIGNTLTWIGQASYHIFWYRWYIIILNLVVELWQVHGILHFHLIFW